MEIGRTEKIAESGNGSDEERVRSSRLQRRRSRVGRRREIYEGCNVESAVSGLGTCAERSAIDHAVLHGNRKVREVAMVMDANKQRKSRMCGACLQYIHDFAINPKIKIVMAKSLDGKVLFDTVEVKTLKELFPSPYKSENCRKAQLT